MSFLDNTGLAYFYSKLKTKFIQSITTSGPGGQPQTLTPDSNGNVNVTQVSLADNLTAPDAQPSIDSFIYRTSGGSVNVQSSEANLVFINGNMTITGREEESASLESYPILDAMVSNIATLRSKVSSVQGDYILNYTCPTSSTATDSWEPGLGTWEYDNDTTTLDLWGITATLIDPTLFATVSGTGITGVTVVPSTFISNTTILDNSSTYYFIYNGSNWTLNETSIDLTDYGISITGTAVTNDNIIINYGAGTQDTELTISYQPQVRGTLNPATPTSFQATGFNQFDKDTMVLENYTITNNTITANSGTYVCYCRAPGGDHGYIAMSLGGHIDTSGGMGWCASVPESGSTVVTTSAHEDDSVTSEVADFTYEQDGYMVVVVDDPDDLMMWCEWSGDVNNQTEYTEYSAPSTIIIPTVGTIDEQQEYLPTYSYGMPRLGTVYDSINFETGQYIKRIERLEYSTANLDTVLAMDPVPVYDYDASNIFYVRTEPLIYTFTNTTDSNDDPIASGVYIVDDHGTEEFVGTTVPVEVELLYGQNLRDKLRTDVLTISKQSPELSATQLTQVYDNLHLSGLHLTGTITSLPYTLNDNRIKESFTVANIVLGSPKNILTDLAWTTSNGSVTFSGTMQSGTSSTIAFDLAPVLTTEGAISDGIVCKSLQKSNVTLTANKTDGNVISFATEIGENCPSGKSFWYKLYVGCWPKNTWSNAITSTAHLVTTSFGTDLVLVTDTTQTYTVSILAFYK